MNNTKFEFQSQQILKKIVIWMRVKLVDVKICHRQFKLKALIDEIAALAAYLIRRNCKLWLLKPCHTFPILPEWEILSWKRNSLCFHQFTLKTTSAVLILKLLESVLDSQSAQTFVCPRGPEKSNFHKYWRKNVSTENRSYYPNSINYAIRMVISYALWLFFLQTSMSCGIICLF